MKILGIDPGLRHTGWGLVKKEGSHLSHIANGVIHSTEKLSLAERLAELHQGLLVIIENHHPCQAAIEETFVNQNPRSTLKLGQARGAVLLAPALFHIPVTEYAPNVIKKSLVGVGHAEKNQIEMMIKMLLPGCRPENADAADALAVAICHAHHLKK